MLSEHSQWTKLTSIQVQPSRFSWGGGRMIQHIKHRTSIHTSINSYCNSTQDRSTQSKSSIHISSNHDFQYRPRPDSDLGPLVASSMTANFNQYFKQFSSAPVPSTSNTSRPTTRAGPLSQNLQSITLQSMTSSSDLALPVSLLVPASTALWTSLDLPSLPQAPRP